MPAHTYDPNDPVFRVTPIQQAIASCSGAILTSLFVTPLDVVKIRMQTQQQAADIQHKCYLYCNGLMDHICSCDEKQWARKKLKFNNTFDAFVKISRAEGVGSLWSGLSPTLILAIPSTIIYFVTYEQTRVRLKDWHNLGVPMQEHVQPHWVPITAGAIARFVVVTIVNPLELIRTKMQSQKHSYTEICIAIRQLIRTDGYRGLMRGVNPTLLRDVPFSMLYWFSYENIKQHYAGDAPPSVTLSFLAGAVSGTIAATITVPFDVVKSQQQIEFGDKLLSNTPHTYMSGTERFKKIYRQNGIRGLYAGLVPRLIKVAPACAVMISTYEYAKVFFHRYRIRQLEASGVMTPSRSADILPVTKNITTATTTSSSESVLTSSITRVQKL